MIKSKSLLSWLELTGSNFMGTVVMTDLVDSTRLVTELGDAGWSNLSIEFDLVVRGAIAEHDGFELERTDGFLVLFDRPISAVLFASALHERLLLIGGELGVQLHSRVGIHLGELILRKPPPEEVARGAKTIQADGIAIPTIARVVGLAKGGQTLLTRGAFDLARRASKDLQRLSGCQWAAHGPYRLQGLEEPIDIFEFCPVGGEGPQIPPGSDKAIRLASPDDAPVLGWRPAPGGSVPSNPHWLLEDRLGEGGFGEVWLCEHHKTRQKRVFKFCFNADRVKGLRREVTLFRLLNLRLGDRPDIAQILDWNFEAPPFYIESEYSQEGSISDYAERIGGFEKTPLPQRLLLAEQTALALAAAHSLAILHKDLKPSNVLLRREIDGSLRAVLADFGIGLLLDPQLLQDAKITGGGFTQTLIGDPTSSRTGTRLYMAPELLEGKEASIATDLYALGVILYQMVVGDPHRALTIDWERAIKSPSLRELLRSCLSGDPQRRPKSAEAIASAIRNHQARDRVILAKRVGGGVLVGSLGVVAVLAIMFSAKQRYSDQGPRVDASDLSLTADRTTVRWWSDYDLVPLPDDTPRPVPAISNDGRYVALAAQRLWLMDRESDDGFRPISDADNGFSTVSFAPNSQLLASGERGGRVDIFSLPEGKLYRPLPGHRTTIHDIQFGRTGSTVAACSEDGVVRVWDSNTGKRLALYSRTGDGVNSWISRVAIDPTESFLAIGHASGGVFAYDLRDPAKTEPIMERQLNASGVVGLAFNGDGTRLAAGTNASQLAVLSFPNGDIVTSTTLNNHPGFKHATRCTSVRYLPESDKIAVAAGPARASEETLNSMILLTNAETLAPELAAESGISSWAARFSDNGRLGAMILSEGVLLASLAHQSVESRKVALPAYNLVSLHSSGTMIIATSNDGSQILELDLESLRARTLRVSGGDVRHSLIGWGEAPNLFLSEDSALLNTRTLPDAPTAPNPLLALNGMGGAATYDQNGGLVIWRRNADTPFAALGKVVLTPSEIFLSPEGDRALVADTVSWAMYSSGWTAPVKEEQRRSALAIAWEQELVVAGYMSGAIAFHTAKEGRRVGGALVYPHRVVGIRPSTDDSPMVAVLHEDDTVMLWNTQTYEPVARLRGEWQNLTDLLVVGQNLALLETPATLHLVPLPEKESQL